MNKNYKSILFLMISLVFFKASFSMGGKIFKAARVIGVTTLPVVGLYNAHETNKDVQFKLELERIPVMQKEVNKWFVEQKKLISMPNLEPVRLVEGSPWRCCGNGKNSYISISAYTATRLNNALLDKTQHDYLGKNAQEIIAQDSMVLRHEFGHIVHQDTQNKMYATALIPIATETLFFCITSSVNKLLKRNIPKSWMSTVGRSSFAVGALFPKILINNAMLLSLVRYQEIQADKFAFENAQSRFELEENIDFLKTRVTDDQYHLAVADRIHMVKSYIDKWDREHSAGEKRT